MFTGNKVLAEVKNPLRNFVEKELPSIDLKQFPGRPAECLNLSIGDPTTSLSYRYDYFKQEQARIISISFVRTSGKSTATPICKAWIRRG